MAASARQKPTAAAPASPEGIIVGPGVTPLATDWIQTQSSHLTAVAEVISHSRAGSVSDCVARLCLDAGRGHLFSRDGSVREAAARVLGTRSTPWGMQTTPRTSRGRWC